MDVNPLKSNSRQGLGLFTTKGIPAHELVTEYIGEIIDHAIARKRVATYRQDRREVSQSRYMTEVALGHRPVTENGLGFSKHLVHCSKVRLTKLSMLVADPVISQRVVEGASRFLWLQPSIMLDGAASCVEPPCLGYWIWICCYRRYLEGK